MQFATVTFAIYFMIVLPVSWLLMPRQGRWKIFVLAASYFFYGYWDAKFVLLLLGASLWNWLAGQAIDQADGWQRRFALGFAVAGNLGVLGYFKYSGFFVTSARSLLESVGFPAPAAMAAVLPPAGVSFFIFQALSYIIDIWRKQIKPVKFVDFAVYLSFFPHLLAGPIVRASEFLPQIKRHDPRKIDASRAFFLIVIGLFMKVVVADFLAKAIVDDVFANPALYTPREVLFAVYSYSAQIYADFFGYTNIAIGLALLLGYKFPQNFNAPYTAVSIQDFWRRWHMTLSRWLRDYLYIPLGGNRGSRFTAYRNLLATMLLGGLWHGAAWTFVAWGAIHGGYLVAGQGRRDFLARRASRDGGASDPIAISPGRRVLSQLVTFHLVAFAWIFFRAESFTKAGELLHVLWSSQGWFEPAPAIKMSVVLAVLFAIGTQYVPADSWERFQAQFSRLTPVPMGLALGSCLLVIDVLAPPGVAPFIYFRF